MKKLLAFFCFAIIGMTMFSCSDSSSDNATTTDNSTIVKEVVADTGKLGYTTYYSLRENKIIDSSLKNTNQWDIAFSATRIYVNGGGFSGGTGIGGAIVLKKVYESLTTAPETGYRADSASTNLAVPGGSENGWYKYNGDTHEITPIAGVVIALKTADGKYAKLQVLSYYKGYPDNIPAVITERRDRMYSFKYFLQKDGSRNLQ